MKRKKREDDTPEGGWQGPPPTTGLKGLRVARKTDSKGNWIWKKIKQTPDDKKLRRQWERRMAKAEERGDWHFPWPPKWWRDKYL